MQIQRFHFFLLFWKKYAFLPFTYVIIYVLKKIISKKIFIKFQGKILETKPIRLATR
jgi:hypothetical protein